VLGDARKAASPTQAEIAERADLMQETVSKVENGDQRACLETVLSLIKVNDLELIIGSKLNR